MRYVITTWTQVYKTANGRVLPIHIINDTEDNNKVVCKVDNAYLAKRECERLNNER